MNMTFLDDLNGEDIDPSDMVALLEGFAELPDDDRSFEATLDVVGSDVGDRTMEYRAALMFRLEALARALQSGQDLRGFARPAGVKGESWISEAVIIAACKCRLVSLDERRVGFDEIEFQTEALRAIEPEGQA